MWRFDRTYNALSHPVRVRANDVPAGRVVHRLLEPFADRRSRAALSTYTIIAHEDEGDGCRFTVRLQDEVVLRSLTAEGAAEWVVWDAHETAAETAERVLVLHASAACWQQQGILLPAPPGSGKTTLVGGLVRAGFSYLSEEYTPFDPARGLIYPFPSPLRIVSGSLGLVGMGPSAGKASAETSDQGASVKRWVRPADLRPGCIGGPCRIAHVLVPSHEPGAGASLEEMSRAEVLTLLFHDSFNLRRVGSAGLEPLARALQSAECHRLRFGDLATALDVIRELVGVTELSTARRVP